MAARRLIAILLVLLFLSSLAAALAPVQEGVRSDSSSSTTTTAEAPAPPGSGTAEPGVVSQTVDASARGPARVRARTGDRLELKVKSQQPGTVELVGLGPAEDVGPRQPAFFDVLLKDARTYPVRFLDSERDVARIVVSSPRPAPATR